MEINNVKQPARRAFGVARFIIAISRLAVLVIMVIAMSIMSPTFFTTNNLLNVLRQAAPIFIIGAGQTVVILARGIDLSMDAVASLTGVVMATLMILVPEPVVTSFTILHIATWLIIALAGMFFLSLAPAVRFARTSLLRIMT